jgi:hypothetical protein
VSATTRNCTPTRADTEISTRREKTGAQLGGDMYYNQEVAKQEAQECKRLFGGSWIILKRELGRFDIVKKTNLMKRDNVNIIEEI